MARLLRGDVYWANLNPTIGDEQSGLRPIIILSHEIFNKKSGTVIAMAITSQTQKAGFPLTYELISKKLPKKSWVKISQIRTISTQRIQKRICSIPFEEVDSLIEGLNEIISN